MLGQNQKNTPELNFEGILPSGSEEARSIDFQVFLKILDLNILKKY